MAFRRSGLETSTPRPGSPTSVASCANFEDRAFQVEEGGSLPEGQLAPRGAAESVREPRSLGQGNADSAFSILSEAPDQALGKHHPKAIFQRKSCAFRMWFFFLLSPPCSSHSPPPTLACQSIVYDCWDNRGGNKEPAERKVLYKTNEHIAGRRGIVS